MNRCKPPNWGVPVVTEPVIPRYRDTPAPAPARLLGAHDVLADAALRNLRQVAAVLIGLAVLFVGGWIGLLLAGAKPVGWGQLVMVLTFTVAGLMLIDAGRRLYVAWTVRVLRAGERWQDADAHWIGRRGVRGRRLMVLSGDGAACLWVRDSSRAAERAVDTHGRVLMLRPTAAGRSAVLVDQRPELLLARVTSST
jgi:hypothetical protein